MTLNGRTYTPKGNLPGLLTGQQKWFTVGSKTGMRKTRTPVKEEESKPHFLGDGQPVSPHFDLGYITQSS